MALRLLAIDTSTEQLAVALHTPHGDFLAHAPGGAQASAALLPRVHALLAEAGVALRDLQAVAFGRGPGAFTGLRTSCAVAQGLAFGIGCPVLALDSLLIVAEDARAQRAAGGEDFEVGVAMDARMQEVYAGRYLWQGGRWAVLAAPALLASGVPLWQGPAPRCVAGTAPGSPLAVERSRAAALLRVALAAWHAGDAVDAAQALPLYLRDRVALTTMEREAARAAKTA